MKRFCFFIFAAALLLSPRLALEARGELLTDSMTEANPVKLGDKIIVGGFYFEDDSQQIGGNLKKYLKNVSAELKKNNFNKLFIDGYTDNFGDNAQNNALSRKRAQAVRKELIANGLPAKKIQARAYGSSNPIASNNTKNGRIQNRRVEILVR